MFKIIKNIKVTQKGYSCSGPIFSQWFPAAYIQMNIQTNRPGHMGKFSHWYCWYSGSKKLCLKKNNWLTKTKTNCIMLVKNDFKITFIQEWIDLQISTHFICCLRISKRYKILCTDHQIPFETCQQLYESMSCVGTY